MKKLFLTICLLLFIALQANAMTENDAKAFFNNYVTKANSYSNEISRMYAPNAVIIRQVIKPNGQLVNAYTNTATYLKQMKISEGVAKARNYKNRYTNITVTKVSKGYKVSAVRHPSMDNDSLKMYQIIAPVNGKPMIVEEMMQTRQQIFLKYAK